MENLVSLLGLESVATYIAALIGVLVASAGWYYGVRKSKQGRHVVCSQLEPVFSHLYLSETARELIDVRYVGDGQPGSVGQPDSMEIDALSEVLIDIKNDSDTDTLNNVVLKFRVPDARVLRVWWEKIPSYLLEESTVDFSSENDPSTASGDTPAWIVHVSLPGLKSHKKYKVEQFVVGILADGNLETIEMLSAGSRRQVPPAQTWTAKFLSFSASQQKAIGAAQLTYGVTWFITLALFLGSMFWIVGSMFANIRPLGWHLLLAFILGFFVSYFLVGFMAELRRAIAMRRYRQLFP